MKKRLLVTLLAATFVFNMSATAVANDDSLPVVYGTITICETLIVATSTPDWPPAIRPPVGR